MKAEYDSLIRNNAFKLVALPEGRDVVDNKWVFKSAIQMALFNDIKHG